MLWMWIKRCIKKKQKSYKIQGLDNIKINMEDKVKISWDPLKWILTRKKIKKKMLVEVMMTNEVFSKKQFFKTNLKKNDNIIS
jgi:hypothetical protein